LLVIVLHRLRKSKLGRAWIAVREDELVAQCLGINPYMTKMNAFVVSACIAALGGSMIAVSMAYISYENFNFLVMSVMVLNCIVLGGMGSLRGAVIGGAVIGSGLYLLQKLINYLQKPWLPQDSKMILFGLVLVLLMIFRPQGAINIRRRKRHPKIPEGTKGNLYRFGERGAS